MTSGVVHSTDLASNRINSGPLGADAFGDPAT